MDEKGQASAELILVTLIVIVITAGLVNFISNETNQNQTGNLGQARMTGENIAEVVNTVYDNGPGYTINLTLPATPPLRVYVTNNTPSITVVCNGQNININVIPTNIQTNLTSLTNINTTNLTYTVKNINGAIVITNKTS